VHPLIDFSHRVFYRNSLSNFHETSPQRVFITVDCHNKYVTAICFTLSLVMACYICLHKSTVTSYGAYADSCAVDSVAFLLPDT